jgi:hypothetical protein
MLLRAGKRKTDFAAEDDLFLNAVAHYTVEAMNRSSCDVVPRLLHREASARLTDIRF